MDKPDKRRHYNDEAVSAGAPRVARKSRSTQAAVRALTIRPKLLRVAKGRPAAAAC